MKKKGFTLLEIIIVIALISIVSAIILPNFTTSTANAKLLSDIASSKIIQNAAAIYDAEQPTPVVKNDINAMISSLYAKNYLKQKTYTPQVTGGIFVYDTTSNIVQLDITSPTVDQKVIQAYDNLSDNDKQFVKK